MDPTRLVVAHDVTLRPFAGGSIVLIGAGAPLEIGPAEEQIVAICARPTLRAELVDVLTESYTDGREAAEQAIDGLVDAGLLSVVE